MDKEGKTFLPGGRFDFAAQIIDRMLSFFLDSQCVPF
jgi:hypothetical protein